MRLAQVESTREQPASGPTPDGPEYDGALSMTGAPGRYHLSSASHLPLLIFQVDLPQTTMASSSRGGPPMPPPRLMEQVRAEIRARHYSRRTEDAYVHWIRRFIVFHGRRHPRDLGAPEISAFVTWLAVEQHVAASTQNQALSGVLFLYRDVLRQEVGAVELLPRARMPSKVPVVLTVAEVRKVLDALTGVPRIVAMLLYGA